MSKNTSNQITYWLGIVAIGLITGLGIQFVQAGWTEPTGNPGAVNVAAPINVSATGQVKDGGLTLNNSSSPAANGLIVANGNVGIGTVIPSAGLKLDIEGKVGATEYCDQNGNNCSAITSMGGSIPSGMIAMFDSSCPSGWTRFTALDGRVPKGSSGYGTTGGAETHSHDVNGCLPGSTCFSAGSGGNAKGISSTSSWSPFLTVIWCKKN